MAIVDDELGQAELTSAACTTVCEEAYDRLAVFRVALVRSEFIAKGHSARDQKSIRRGMFKFVDAYCHNEYIFVVSTLDVFELETQPESRPVYTTLWSRDLETGV